MNSDALIFTLYAIGLAGQLGDCYTTEIGLAHGLAEGNPIAKWIVSKIGNTGATLLKCVGFATVFPMLSYILSHQLVWAFVGAEIPVIGLGWYASVTNYLLLKKNKIAL